MATLVSTGSPRTNRKSTQGVKLRLDMDENIAHQTKHRKVSQTTSNLHHILTIHYFPNSTLFRHLPPFLLLHTATIGHQSLVIHFSSPYLHGVQLINRVQHKHKDKV